MIMLLSSTVPNHNDADFVLRDYRSSVSFVIVKGRNLIGCGTLTKMFWHLWWRLTLTRHCGRPAY